MTDVGTKSLGSEIATLRGLTAGAHQADHIFLRMEILATSLAVWSQRTILAAHRSDEGVFVWIGICLDLWRFSCRWHPHCLSCFIKRVMATKISLSGACWVYAYYTIIVYNSALGHGAGT